MAKSKWIEIKEKLKDIEKWAVMGLSDTQIAFNLGISKDTFYRYKKEHSDFSDILKRGKNQADFKVENALYKKATGYMVKKVGVVKCKDIYYDDKGNKCQKEHAETVDYEEEMPADVQAIKFWLINRKSGRWKDNPTKADIDRQVLELKKQQVKNEEW